jgi:hypothetical protein
MDYSIDYITDNMFMLQICTWIHRLSNVQIPLSIDALIKLKTLRHIIMNEFRCYFNAT